MNHTDVLLLVLIAAQVIGGFLLKGWIASLRGIVDAQRTMIDTVMTVFKASDPERWAREVQVHKDLADKKVAILVAEEQAKGEAELKALDRRASNFLQGVGGVLRETQSAAFRFLAEIPKDRRTDLIRDMSLSPSVSATLLEAAADLPEPVSSVEQLPSMVRAAVDAYRRYENEARHTRETPNPPSNPPS